MGLVIQATEGALYLQPESLPTPSETGSWCSGCQDRESPTCSPSHRKQETMPLSVNARWPSPLNPLHRSFVLDAK